MKPALENAEIFVKAVIQSSLYTVLHVDLISKPNWISALTNHIYKDLTQKEVAWALKKLGEENTPTLSLSMDKDLTSFEYRTKSTEHITPGLLALCPRCENTFLCIREGLYHDDRIFYNIRCNKCELDGPKSLDKSGAMHCWNSDTWTERLNPTQEPDHEG